MDPHYAGSHLNAENICKIVSQFDKITRVCEVISRRAYNAV